MVTTIITWASKVDQMSEWPRLTCHRNTKKNYTPPVAHFDNNKI